MAECLLYLWLSSALAVTNVLIVATDVLILRHLGALLLLCFLPGYAFLALIPEVKEADWLERIVLSCGVSYALSTLSALLVHYLPGRMTPASLLLVCDALVLAPLALALLLRKGSAWTYEAPGLITGREWALLVLLLIVTSFTRLASLGYSEFQGDEALVMLRAAQAIEGRDDALFAHGKGPVEILIPTTFWLLTGQINELGARLPFALAGLLAVITAYLLGRRMFNERVGWAAGFLLAVNGYFVGFGRIVQYQSLVFWMVGLALFCYHWFYTEGLRRYQILGALFLAYGLLAHYDAVLILPAILYFYWKVFGPGLKDRRRYVLSFVTSLAVFAVVVGVFYLPFWCDPQSATTYRYLVGTRMGDAVLKNNLRFFFLQSTVYNSTYYFLFVTLLLGLAAIKRLSSFPRSRYLGPALLVIVLTVTLLYPQWWRVGGMDWTLAPFLVIILALWASPGASVEWKTCLIWFAVPFLFYIFLIQYPLTHVYTFLPAWTLLAGTGFDEAWGLAVKEGRGVWRARVGIAILIALYLVFAYYIYLAFIQRRPEYIWTYPAHRNAFYWTPYRELPEAAFFGFPYRAGWKAIGGLYGVGALEGDYGSNEEGEITAWYARGTLRSYCDDPEYYIIADRVRDERLGRPDPLAKGYVPAGAVSVDGKPRLRLYRRAPANALSAVYEAVEYEAAFDLGTRPEAVAHQPAPDHPLRADLGHRVRLLGYDLKATQARPGDILVLTLYWQAIAPMSVDYSVFVHLESDRIWGQRDGLPLCGFYRTSDWRPGDVVVERYRVPIDSATPAGEYPLQIGMYDPLDGQRLEVFGERGEALGNSIFLERIMISGD